MTPVNARSATDCVRACIASILDMSLDDVPDFARRSIDPASRIENGGHIPPLKVWANGRGYDVIRFYLECRLPASYATIHRELTELVPNVYMMVGDGHHAVVVRGGEIVHDPSAHLGARLIYEQIESYTIFVPHDPGRFIVDKY